MKNVFCLIIDALSYPYMCDRYNAMPFLRLLSEKGCNCLNMYSQGPYTEAALTPFYTGRDNMDFGGNFFRGDQVKKTVFECFSDSGYDVLNYTQPLIYPKPMHRGINEERYGVCYFFSAVWDYRLSYYAGLYKEGKLQDEEYDKIYELLDVNFDFWLTYLTLCRNNAKEADFIRRFASDDFDFTSVAAQVSGYRKVFLKDKKAFVTDLFRQGKKHKIFKIENYFMLSKCENSQLFAQIKKEFQTLFKKIDGFNKSHNRSDDYSVKALLNVCLDLLRGQKTEAYESVKKFYYHRKIRTTKKEIDKMFDLQSNYKPEPTILRYFEHFCGWCEARESDKPYYCTMHVSDLHTPEIFFSIDSQSLTEVENELKTAEDYLSSLPDDFSGNVMYYLSMRYVDSCVEKMFRWFKEKGMLQSTLFVITADHGSSFGFRPVRPTLVNNEHDENYHIPCIFFGEGAPCGDREGYYTTKDIAKTVLEYGGIKDGECTGNNIFDDRYVGTYAITEYLGGGCPDMKRKPILFVVRDDYYSIGLRQYVDEEFSSDNIFCVYDRKNDSGEIKNLVHSVAMDDIRYLVEKAEARFKQIKGDYYENKA